MQITIDTMIQYQADMNNSIMLWMMKRLVFFLTVVASDLDSSIISL